VRQALAKNKTFLFPYALLFCAACFVIAYTDKIQLHIYFNSLLTPWLNVFFKYITNLGDGLFVMAVGFLLFVFNMRKGMTMLIGYGLSAGFTQGIKYAFFGDADRPQLVFQQQHLPLNLVDNLVEEQHIHHSFPSGHATAAFAMFFCLSFLAEKIYFELFFFVMALVVAFSRVYLSQHFFEDITAGSLIAVCFSTLACWFFYHSQYAGRLNRLDKPLYRLF
jgi:membrane-associated phospholipid phosphatase